MIDRRDFLKGMSSSLVTGVAAATLIDRLAHPLLAWALPERDALSLAGPALRARAAAKGLFYGAATIQRFLFYDTNFNRKFAEECGVLSPEADLKWNALRPTPNEYNFSNFDWLMNYTQTHQMLFRGHPLVWHDALPLWFAATVNSKNAEQYLVDHVTTVVKRHAGKVHSWDVVNEALAVWDKHPDGLRSSSPWFKLLGPQYIDIAFKAAAKADPKAILVLNQNHLEQVTGDHEETRDATLKLLRRMKASGTPIHALGIESHLGGRRYQFDPARFRSFLREVSGLGLKIIITELDVTDTYLPGDVVERDRMVAQMCEEYLATALDEKAVIGVLTWGLSDKYSWLAKYAQRSDRLPVRPLPLNDQLNRKPAWGAIARCLDNAPHR